MRVSYRTYFLLDQDFLWHIDRIMMSFSALYFCGMEVQYDSDPRIGSVQGLCFEALGSRG